MGTAENWQVRIEQELTEVVILNPRRDNWDVSLRQSIEEEGFVEQVVWELSGIEKANIVIVYFDPKTKSPITLLELGILSQLKPSETIVCCPEGFHRKGNVDIVCKRYGIPQEDSLEQLILKLKEQIQKDRLRIFR